MKKFFFSVIIISLASLLFFSCDSTEMTDDSMMQLKMADSEQLQQDKANDGLTSGKKSNCTTIQSGELVDSQGETLHTGFTDFGYNYQGHIYNGDYYDDGFKLVMKWNDSWLSNKDCDGDGLLDRHYGHESYIGSGAWLTNHWTGTYLNEDGEECSYDEFLKIIAVPADAYETEGIWYNSDDVEIGQSIWGQFAIIQQVVDDPCEGLSGIQYKSADHPGLGNW